MDFIDKVVEQMEKNYNDSIFDLLEKNGYDVEPRNAQRATEICQELKLKGLFIDTIQYTDYDFKNSRVTQHIYPFFNHIDNPITDKQKEDMLKRFKENENATNKN